ncbi:serine hydrolase domain-containing protein [Rhizobium calliandrae]|uniref:Serine hydrolase domain-containing protein n=1 Tax=Rhizobium calliandrae TaxID=1312182 RepID=A0ABT7KNI5_9HYPH|nr:serine hydrolase domain-containing protein [Rhizobium calliandrae]MDL2410205.1 serine hydrolase domain-containing protein [Rhizobium calliandrae]
MKMQIDAVIDKAIMAGKIVGTVVIVVREGETVYSRAAGYADREIGKPAETQTIFRLASVTKPLVAATALALVDKGRLALSDLVSNYLPYFRPRQPDGEIADITIHHLLTHTAGLSYGADSKTTPLERLYNGGLADTDLDFEENFSRLSTFPLLAMPGTLWSYSIAIDVLGAVIAQIEACSLGEAVRRHVTEPLGMDDTDFSVSDPERLATPYADSIPAAVRMSDCHLVPDSDGNLMTFAPTRLFNPKAFQSGGAGMVGTAPDLITFLEAVRRGGTPILKNETAKTALLNQIGKILRPGEPGQGFSFLGALIQDPILAEVPMSKGSVTWGGVYGHNWFIDPIEGISTAIMSNTAVEGCLGSYPKDIARAIYGA